LELKFVIKPGLVGPLAGPFLFADLLRGARQRRYTFAHFRNSTGASLKVHFCRTRNLAYVAGKRCGMPVTWTGARSFVRSCVWELPCSVAQKNARLSRDLSAKRNAPFGKTSRAAGLLEGNVSFLFYFDENVTVAECVESANRIRALDFRGEQQRCSGAPRAVCGAKNFESISLLSARHGVFVNCSRRPRP
jgi:hypothetical protein